MEHEPDIEAGAAHVGADHMIEAEPAAELSGALHRDGRPGMQRIERHGLGDARVAAAAVNDEQRPRIACGAQLVFRSKQHARHFGVNVGIEQRRIGPCMVVAIVDDLDAQLNRNGAQVVNGVAIADRGPHRLFVRRIAPSVAQADHDDLSAPLDQLTDLRQHLVIVGRARHLSRVIDGFADAKHHVRRDDLSEGMRALPVVQRDFVPCRDQEADPRALALHQKVGADRGRESRDRRAAKEFIEREIETLAAELDAVEEAFRDVVRRGEHLRRLHDCAVGEEAVSECAADIDIQTVQRRVSNRRQLRTSFWRQPCRMLGSVSGSTSQRLMAIHPSPPSTSPPSGGSAMMPPEAWSGAR